MAKPVSHLPKLPPIPGYRVQRFVGRGGMGVVYEAIHLATGRAVALKLVNPSGAHDPVARERFDREVRTLAALKHPNIIPVYDAGDWHGFPYCAMEFVPGGTLSQHLDRIRADLRTAVRLMAKVARAVAAMHAAGILHRDLKPLNILLGPDDEPMVADFGLVRREAECSDLTYTGLPVGTRQYMAPEQTLGRRGDYTPACDVWGIGVTLYELLTGTRPFSDDGISDLYLRIRSEEAPAISSLAPAVPAELQAIVGKCLAKRPEERYSSAAMVADDLERWLAGDPVIVLPSPAPALQLLTTVSDAPPIPASSWRTRGLLAVVAVTLVAVASAWTGGAFRDRKPQTKERKKTLVERIAAGEKVKLTDEKGVPLVPWTPTAGHELTEKSTGDYHGFSSNGSGLVGLADEAWELPIRIEAEVAVSFQSTPGTCGGVYVGRRNWVNEATEHQSLICVGISPRNASKPPFARELLCREDLLFWESNTAASPYSFEAKVHPWDGPGRAQQHRFASVVIECADKEVRATVDGQALTPVSEKMMLAELLRKSRERPRFARDLVHPPAFGTGIGIFLQNADCVVRNLTVSKP
jgi:hypothetical protein